MIYKRLTSRKPCIWLRNEENPRTWFEIKTQFEQFPRNISIEPFDQLILFEFLRFGL